MTALNFRTIPTRKAACSLCGSARSLIDGAVLVGWRDGLSLRSVARSVGISPSHLCDMEKNRRGISREMAQRVADAIRDLRRTR